MWCRGSLCLFVCLCLLGLVWGQDEDDELCVCVDPSDCVNGNVRPGVTLSSVDYRRSPCDGVKFCCSPPPGSSPPQPSEGDTFGSSSSGSGTFGSGTSGSGTFGSGAFGSSGSFNEASNGQKLRLPSKASLQGCGVRRFNSSQPKINSNMIRVNTDRPEDMNLTETFYGELPWLVRISVNDEFSCGGTLISNQVVLTAAHCIEGKDRNELSLVAGEWNSKIDIEPIPPQKRDVGHIVKHDKFKSANGENDVALLFAATPFDLNAAVDYACYPDTHKLVNQNECYAAGWGKGQETEPGYSPVLRKIHMPILDRTRCETKFRRTTLGEQFILLPGFLCAGGTDNRDTCKGDGGGPLYCAMLNEPNRFAVIGVISWGIDCGKGNPTVCASVPYYFTWISQHIHDWPNLKTSAK